MSPTGSSAFSVNAGLALPRPEKFESTSRLAEPLRPATRGLQGRGPPTCEPRRQLQPQSRQAARVEAVLAGVKMPAQQRMQGAELWNLRLSNATF